MAHFSSLPLISCRFHPIGSTTSPYLITYLGEDTSRRISQKNGAWRHNGRGGRHLRAARGERRGGAWRGAECLGGVMYGRNRRMAKRGRRAWASSAKRGKHQAHGVCIRERRGGVDVDIIQHACRIRHC